MYLRLTFYLLISLDYLGHRPATLSHSVKFLLEMSLLPVHRLIPGVNGSSSTSGNARDNRLQGAALSIATAARAQNATSRAYTLRSDGTYALPTDALGIEGMFSSYGGPGLVDGTTFRDTLYLTQVAQAHCVTTEAEKYRRIMTECAPGGGGGCTMVSM